MTESKIITDNKPRAILCWLDLPEAAQKDFDYTSAEAQEENCSNFFKYRDTYYDLTQFVRMVPASNTGNLHTFAHHTDDKELLKWDGISADSYFSAVVVKYVSAGDEVVIGLYLAGDE